MSERRSDIPALHFFTRAGCALCDRGFPIVEQLAREHGLGVVEVDIASDPLLVDRHGERIPVVEFDGRELGWGRLSERALRRELARALGR